MERMKYRMASRATILLGRESVSKADGAIIELIKNTYDADADFCYICFDAANDKIYLLDNGTGMTRQIIEDCWMMIGTDNKRAEYYSSKKRIKSGEKGIGRFALDRLGAKCTMFTKSSTEKLIKWSTNWSNFEVPGRMLDEVEAEFEYLDIQLEECVPDTILCNIKTFSEEKERALLLNKGTLLVISELRDKWSESDISKVAASLSFLIPPGEQSAFTIFAQRSMDSKAIEISSDVSSDFDYRIVASFDGKNFTVDIERNELNFDIIPAEVFSHERFSKEPYRLSDLQKAKITKTFTIPELMHNTDPDYCALAEGVGAFKFTYSFMKVSTREDGRGKNYYRPVGKNRKKWLEEYAGIKIYRDNFVVRPYGDKLSNSFDWLNLDARKGVNPVAVSDKSEKWHVSNSQGQGTVFISRVNNSSILDKSSREGIIENEYFAIFCEMIKELLGVFEKDRAYIARTLRLYTEEQDEREKAKERARKIADSKLKKGQEADSDKGEDEPEDEVTALAQAVKIYEEEVEELASEIRLLRALATNGLITSSMIHDLKSINAMLVSRVGTLQIALNSQQPSLVARHLDDLRTNDEFLKSWITVITNQTTRDKRTRVKRNIIAVVQNTVHMLDPILNRKKVSIEIASTGDSFERRIFEIDFDSIIYNLIVNSIESFEHAPSSTRRITISMESINNELIIHYRDYGAGLSEAFLKDPYSIFEYGVTSKYDSEGNQIGTGLGMYIVASSVTEYGGRYTLTEIRDGFGIDIIIPGGGK